MPRKEAPPYVSEYPPLDEWLRKINAVCNWQRGIGNRGRGIEDDPRTMIENWTANGRVFVLLIYCDHMGWEIFTAADSNEVSKTLTDAEARLGLPKHNHPQSTICHYGCPVHPSAKEG